MNINLLDLWNNMGWPVRSVVILLTVQATASLAAVIDRLVLISLSKSRARAAAEVIQPAVAAGDAQRALKEIATVKPNHLRSYLEVGLRSFFVRRQAGDTSKEAVELVRRALERKGDSISRDLNRGMNLLASTGSTAPFVGLLGTVLGIINAFKMIASTGAGGIDTIGAAIGEALVVTGYGLMVAIPAVLLFNWLSGRIADYEAGLLNAGAEMVDTLQTGGDRKPLVTKVNSESRADSHVSETAVLS